MDPKNPSNSPIRNRRDREGIFSGAESQQNSRHKKQEIMMGVVVLVGKRPSMLMKICLHNSCRSFN